MTPVETPEIGIDQLAEAVRGGAVIVDVREPHEYVAGHVPGAC
jgi:rhodanese-related sulfurtransferase